MLTSVHSSENFLYPSTVKTSILFKISILTLQEFFEFTILTTLSRMFKCTGTKYGKNVSEKKLNYFYYYYI
jgi:hypothetical protein